jgi:Rps23 Pro-64 3,4-dihydroxylase Tpa1-like proline 4-hydroxylase
MPYLCTWGIDTIENITVVTGTRGNFCLSRLNERLRILKYEGGEYFKPHTDGFYEISDKRETSYYTIHLY